MGLEPTSRVATLCFQDRALIRPDDFRSKLLELESNQRPPSSEPGVTTNSNYPAPFLCLLHQQTARGEGVEPSSPGSKPGSLPLADPRSIRVPCGSRTHLARLEAWNLCRSAKGTFLVTCVSIDSGRRGSRTLKAVLLDRFRDGCHHPLACPSVFFLKLRRKELNLQSSA